MPKAEAAIRAAAEAAQPTMLKKSKVKETER